jgi:hypothetical protein
MNGPTLKLFSDFSDDYKGVAGKTIILGKVCLHTLSKEFVSPTLIKFRSRGTYP